MERPTRTALTMPPPPAFRVFVSSTYSDMLPYREAVQTAVKQADCLPYGMERFGMQTPPPLEVCYNELEMCVLGMRYGCIDQATQKSYTQLEFEKAKELGIPILVFIIDEEKMSFKLSGIELGQGAEKLKAFKEAIKNSKDVTCDFFSTPMSLQEEVLRSLMVEKKRQGTQAAAEPQYEDYREGATMFRNFVRRPARYRGKVMTLRVRMDGLYGGWKLKDELFEAFHIKPSDALYLNELWVQGRDNIDVDTHVWGVDGFAQGGAADWLDKNEVTTGTVFEGRFMTAYEEVPRTASAGGEEESMMVAKLILLEGISVIERDVPTHPELYQEATPPLNLAARLLAALSATGEN